MRFLQLVSQRIISFDNYTDTAFIFYGMLIVFTGGHGGLFVGYRHSYTRHALSFCPPVTAHTGQLVVWSPVSILGKELPAGSGPLTAKIFVIKLHHQMQVQDRKEPKIWECCLVPEMAIGSKQATGAVENAVHRSEGSIRWKLGYLESNFNRFLPQNHIVNVFVPTPAKTMSPLFIILR